MTIKDRLWMRVLHTRLGRHLWLGPRGRKMGERA